MSLIFQAVAKAMAGMASGNDGFWSIVAHASRSTVR
jgi:hypothetical protein